MLRAALILSALFLHTAISAQKTPLTIDSIVEDDPFARIPVPTIHWMNDGETYAQPEALAGDTIKSIIVRSILKNEVIDTLYYAAGEAGRIEFDDFSLSPDEKYVLFSTRTKRLFRRSFEASFLVLDISGKKLYPIAGGSMIANASFSPNSKMIAYTKAGNLFYTRLDNFEEYEITKTGVPGRLLHGHSDWVYEEEFGMTKAYEWSPDSKFVAYLTFNESQVEPYQIQIWNDNYPSIIEYRYPRPGGKNSEITVSVYNIENNTTKKMNTGVEKDIYIPAIQWTANSMTLSILMMNRVQNRLEVLHANTSTGSTISVLKESSKTYIDINTKIIEYLADNTFIFSSDREGNNHLYHHDIDGQLIQPLTSGGFEVIDYYGVDDKKRVIYFSSNDESALEKHIYSKPFKGSKYRKLSIDSGYNDASFSKMWNYFTITHSSIKQPHSTVLYNSANLKPIRVMQDNAKQIEKLANYDIGQIQFFQFRNAEQTNLNGYLITPVDFDSTSVYPLLIYVYGGPGSQRVLNTFNLRERAFHHYLAGRGYVVACVDNRGTGGRGRDFKNMTYMQLGKLEMEDQIAAIKFLGEQSFIEKDKIGIWGKSYGGYMSALTLFNAANLLRYGIAVAPVTDWRLYNTIYTERYMQRPTDNPTGYDESAPVFDAHRLDDPFLLIHGTGDDNVHLQHSIALSEALTNAQKPFSTMYYANRRHALQGKTLKKHFYTLIERFIYTSVAN